MEFWAVNHHNLVLEKPLPVTTVHSETEVAVEEIMHQLGPRANAISCGI